MTEPLNKYLMQLRRTGSKGSVIPVHHSFTTMRFTAVSLLAIILLPLLFDVGLWLVKDIITAYWRDVINMWLRFGGSQAEVGWTDVAIVGQPVAFPFPKMVADLPSHVNLIVTGIVCFALFLVSFLIPGTLLPASYMLRAAAFLQLTTVGYFAWWPHEFPYQVPDYVAGSMALNFQLLFIIPLVLALIYYIFDFLVWKKVWLTLLTLAYFIIVTPFQYMLHAWIMYHTSVILMPMLYLMFGLLLDIMMFVAFYAWGMSWKGGK